MKTIVITGGNSGLGLETAKILLKDGANKLILGCRNQEKALLAVERLKRESGNYNVQTRFTRGTGTGRPDLWEGGNFTSRMPTEIPFAFADLSFKPVIPSVFRRCATL